MKKNNIQLLINPQMTFSYWKGVESEKAAKKINDGVIQIGEVVQSTLENKLLKLELLTVERIIF